MLGGHTRDPDFLPDPSDQDDDSEDDGVKSKPGGARERKALIVGDSQAEASNGLGAAFESELKGMGYSVTRSARGGETGPEVYRRLVDNYVSAGRPELVVAIFGSNGTITNTQQSAADMISFCEENGATLIAVGPGPAVQIENITLAQQVFSNPNINTTDHWTTGPGSSKNAGRKTASDYIDNLGFRDGVFGYGIMTNMNRGGGIEGVYTSQPDGVHIVNGAAQIASEIIDAVKSVGGFKSVPQEGTSSEDSDYNSSVTGLDLTEPTNYADMSFDDCESVPSGRVARIDAHITNPPDWDALFDTAGAKHGIDPDFLRAIAATESALNPNIGKSTAGAAGLMQIMPTTATSLGLTVDASTDDRLDTAKAIDAAARLLKTNRDRYGATNLPELAGSYNAGPGYGPDYGKAGRDKKSRMEYYVSIPETRNYMQLVMASYHHFGGVGYE